MSENLAAALANLSTLGKRQASADRRIAEAAEQRRAEIDDRLRELRPRVIVDAAAGEEYQSLILERGRLDRVLARVPD